MDDFERIYRDWHEYAKNRDTDALIALYADDAVFESPLVPIIMQRDDGTLRGRAEIRAFLAEGARRRPKAGVSETVASRRSRAAPPGPDRRRIEGVAGAESPPASG